MAKKITIQHLYTTTGTTAPTGDLALGLGEISISHLDDNEAIFIKPGGGKDGKPVRENKFIPQYQIEKLINTKLSEAGVESPGVITALTSDLNTHKNTEGNAGVKGHVELIQGDLSEITAYTAGHAAASYHEHSQYLEPEQQLGYGFSSTIGMDNGPKIYSVKNGTGITVNDSGVSISIEYQNLINSGVTANREIVTHKAVSGNTDQLGHVKLKSGDLSSITAITSGEAAASYHTHGQYLKETDIISGIGINVTNLGMPGIVSVNISDEYQGKITNGATAYSWGDHTKAGYAINTDLTTLRNSVTAHTSNGDIHVTAKDKNAWNQAKSDIDAFMAAAESGNTALDTLKEIQDFLTSDDGTVQTLLDNLDVLTTDVENNTTAITKNTTDITTISGNVNTISGRVDTLSTNLENVFTNFTHSITGTGSNIKVEEKGVTEKNYEISHTGAGNVASAITATNDNTVISFGTNFNIVNKIAYDANGHVVSGSTQTLTLPNLLTATTDNYGVVKLKSGELTLTDELVNNKEYLSTAAGVAHGHTEYVKYNDLTNYTGSEPLVISCGTY